MPIAQSRMIALINAARDFQDAMLYTRQVIRQAHASASSVEVQKLLAQMLFDTDPLGILRDPIGSNLIIQQEETHFRKFQNINTQAAKRAAMKRDPEVRGSRAQDLGVQPRGLVERPVRSTAPHSMVRRAEISGSIQDELKQELNTRTSKPDAPGLYDPPDEVNAESLGSGLTLDISARAEIEAMVKEEIEADELAHRLANPEGKE